MEKLYKLLSETRGIYAPVVAADKQVEYKYNPAFSDVTFNHVRSTLSVKNVVFRRWKISLPLQIERLKLQLPI